jgi:hypothetical protein
MTADMVARTIQLILAPVVMISACGLVLTGLLARYAAVNDRLRALARERLELWPGMAASDDALEPAAGLAAERRALIDGQTPGLLRHHRLLHDAVLAVYTAVLVFVACMFVIALAALTERDWLASAALVLFLGGTAILLAGVLLTAVEVRTSHEAVQFEVRRVMRLAPTPTTDPDALRATTHCDSTR